MLYARQCAHSNEQQTETETAVTVTKGVLTKSALTKLHRSFALH